MGKDQQRAPDVFWYRIDAEDRITSVCPEWPNFASQNGAPRLDAERVVGRDIYGFIADPETRHLYGAIFEKVRKTGQEVRVPFRCDSPALRRYMELTVRQARPEGALEISTKRLKLERRKSTLRLLEARPSGPTKLSICSWCERIKYPGKGWIDVDEAVTGLRLFDTVDLPALYPAACSSCLKNFREKLQLRATAARAATKNTPSGSDPQNAHP